MTAYLLTIGDEILIGQIIDTNSAWMCQELNLRGFQVLGKSSVADNPEAIVEGLEIAARNADVIIMTGGLGPTKDDLTKATLAAYFGSPMVFHQDTYDRIAAYFNKIGKKIHEAAILQATLPEQALILTNKVGSAPGMWFERAGKVIIALPGVPFEMKYLMSAEVLPRLTERFPGRPIAHRTLLTVGEGESNIAKRIEAFEDALPANVKLAYLPALGQVRLRLTGTLDEATTPGGTARLDALLDTKKRELEALIPDLVYGYDDDSLEKILGQILLAQKKKFGTAESCTGGYIAHLITSVPGSSNYFPGTIVSYSYEMKTKLLGVQPDTLTRFGAVSEETAREMARGALSRSGASIAYSVTGVAGPTGGTASKPVGMVCFGFATADDVFTATQHFAGDRNSVREQSVNFVLHRLAARG